MWSFCSTNLKSWVVLSLLQDLWSIHLPTTIRLFSDFNVCIIYSRRVTHSLLFQTQKWFDQNIWNVLQEDSGAPATAARGRPCLGQVHRLHPLLLAAARPPALHAGLRRAEGGPAGPLPPCQELHPCPSHTPTLLPSPMSFSKPKQSSARGDK